jgi:hypothetical protein
LLGLILTDFFLTFIVPSGIARVVIMASIALGLAEAFKSGVGSNVSRGMFLILSYTANIFDKMIIAGAGAITARGLIEKVGGHHAARWRGGTAARGVRADPAQKSREFLLWHEASTEEAATYLGADLLSCRQNATHSCDIDRLLNHPLGRPDPIMDFVRDGLSHS